MKTIAKGLLVLCMAGQIIPQIAKAEDYLDTDFVEWRENRDKWEAERDAKRRVAEPGEWHEVRSPWWGKDIPKCRRACENTDTVTILWNLIKPLRTASCGETSYRLYLREKRLHEVLNFLEITYVREEFEQMTRIEHYLVKACKAGKYGGW